MAKTVTDNRALRMLDVSPVALRLLVAALVYVALGWISQQYFSIDHVVGIFWPASGWALATLLLGGRQYAWAALLGGTLTALLSGSAVLPAMGVGIATSAGALLAHGLLTRKAPFDINLTEITRYRDLLLQGALPAAALSSVLGVASLVIGGALPKTDILGHMALWFFGDSLGTAVITPLLLFWRAGLKSFINSTRWLEALFVMVLTVAMGQMVYLEWLPEFLPNFSRKAIWVVAPCMWAAIRIGPQLTSALISILAIQISLSVCHNVGFLANPQLTIRLIDGWVSIVIIGTVLVALASYIRQRSKTEADLRIAAIAFECQEGMIITDADMRILRVNQSFTRIMGYSAEEVLGQTTGFMRSDRHPADFYLNAWRTAREQGIWNDEVWHKRKNGEIFPQWLTATAVRDANGAVTNYVVTHTDISYRKQQEAEQLSAQLAQRDALVREVHHRIKNNLQGITGLLRQFAQANPETAGPINQAIGQVRSIAAIHGLQGRSVEGSVRLCELTGLIAGDISSLWQVPVRVDIPSPWTPCLIAEAEAVPLALVLNELIINAVKHAQPPAGEVEVRLHKGSQADHILIRISNQGTWQATPPGSGSGRSGLQLVDSMLPHSGAQLSREQRHGMIHVTLMLEPPVISLETSRNTHVPEPDTQNPALAGG